METREQRIERQLRWIAYCENKAKQDSRFAKSVTVAKDDLTKLMSGINPTTGKTIK